jgi:hypothetical protein
MITISITFFGSLCEPLFYRRFYKYNVPVLFGKCRTMTCPKQYICLFSGFDYMQYFCKQKIASTHSLTDKEKMASVVTP